MTSQGCRRQPFPAAWTSDLHASDSWCIPSRGIPWDSLSSAQVCVAQEDGNHAVVWSRYNFFPVLGITLPMQKDCLELWLCVVSQMTVS